MQPAFSFPSLRRLGGCIFEHIATNACLVFYLTLRVEPYLYTVPVCIPFAVTFLLNFNFCFTFLIPAGGRIVE